MSSPRPIPTQDSIAKAVGLSRVTVSHILSGKEIHRYKEETRRKVLEMAESLGYRPHRAAQMIRKGRSNLLGVVHFGAANHIARQHAHYLPQAIHERGYDPLVVDLSWHGDSYRRGLDHLLNSRVEAILICGLVESFGKAEIDLLAKQGIPMVILASVESDAIPSVSTDTAGAVELLVEHLAEEGHRELLLLVNDYQSITTLKRMEGFRKGVERCQMQGVKGEVATLTRDQDNFVSGTPAYQYMRALIRSGKLPDAILCSNDQWAQAVFTAAFEAGLRIPEDIAVTGIDNDPLMAQVPYQLTSVSADIGAMCQRAVDLLARQLEGESNVPKRNVFPFKLFKRRSSLGKSVAAAGPQDGYSLFEQKPH